MTALMLKRRYGRESEREEPGVQQEAWVALF
jgi:hypothetical protein